MSTSEYYIDIIGEDETLRLYPAEFRRQHTIDFEKSEPLRKELLQPSGCKAILKYDTTDIMLRTSLPIGPKLLIDGVRDLFPEEPSVKFSFMPIKRSWNIDISGDEGLTELKLLIVRFFPDTYQTNRYIGNDLINIREPDQYEYQCQCRNTKTEKKIYKKYVDYEGDY